MPIRDLIRRLATIPLALLLANFLSYAYAHYALPLYQARNPFSTTEAIDLPLLPAYSEYLKALLRLDLGEMPGTFAPLIEVLQSASKASLGLISITIFISILIGLTLGMQAARHQPPRVARWLTLVSTVGLAMPSFYLGTLLVVGSIIYAVRAGDGTQPPLPLTGFGWDNHLVFPILVLMARPAMEIAQVTANATVNEFNKQYVVAARSIGNGWRAVRWRHVFNNAIAPIIISVSRSIRLLVGELILVEFLFSWPGLGRLLAISLTPSRTTAGGGGSFLYPPLIAGVITVLAIFFLLIDLIASMLLYKMDPRLQHINEEGRNG